MMMNPLIWSFICAAVMVDDRGYCPLVPQGPNVKTSWLVRDGDGYKILDVKMYDANNVDELAQAFDDRRRELAQDPR